MEGLLHCVPGCKSQNGNSSMPQTGRKATCSYYHYGLLTQMACSIRTDHFEQALTNAILIST